MGRVAGLGQWVHLGIQRGTLWGPDFCVGGILLTAYLYVRMGRVSIVYCCVHRGASYLHEKPRRKTSVCNPK